MVYVGSDWVELGYWTSPSWGDYDARMRVLAYSTQDIASNTSRIYFKLQKRVTGGSAYNLDDISFRITGTGAGGDGHSATQTWNFGTVSSTAWQDVGGDTSDMYWSGVKHRDDGSLTLTATASGGRPLGGPFSNGITIELPTIARASVPTASPNPATIGSGGRVVTINTNRKSSSFLHTVSLRCGNWTWSSAAKGVGGSVNVTIPYSVIAQFAATSKTATCTITCVTYSGNTNIGTKTATFKLQIDTATDHPQVDSVTVEDLNTKSAAIEAAGSFINNASHLKATIDLSAVGTYTELASARVVCGSTAQSYTLSGTSQTIIFEYDKVNTSDLTVYVTDKRGTTVSFVKSWTLVPYVDLTVSGSVDRLSETGNTIKFTLTGRCFAGDFGQATNQLTIKYKSKLHSAADYPTQWTALGTVTPSGQGATTYETSGTLTGFDYDQQYDLIFHVEDLFTEAQTGEIGLTKGIPVYGNGEDFFAVYGNLHIHSRVDPMQFWTLSPDEDLHDSITEVSDSVAEINNSLAMHNYTWSGSWSNGGSAARNIQITGKGIVIINCYVRNDGTADTGQCDATITLRNTSNVNQRVLAASANRVSETSGHQISANAATAWYYDGSTADRRLYCAMSCTKNGTNSWRIEAVTIGCTLAVL